MKKLLAVLLLLCCLTPVLAQGISSTNQSRLNNALPATKTARLGSMLDALFTRPIVFLLAGTAGCKGGPAADGVLAGAITQQAIAAFKMYDYSEGTYVTDTTDINDADTNDVDLYPATPGVGDANYWGMTTPWCRGAVTVGTAASSLVMTTVAEYWNGSSWATLTLTFDETSLMQPSATGVKCFAFVPPADWRRVTVDGTLAYWIRFRVTAYTSKTALPVLSRAYATDFTHGTGLAWPETGTLRKLQWTAGTKSGTTADTKLLVINLTKGTWDTLTLTKATAIGSGSVNLAIAENDRVAVQQVQGDGSTEFADVMLWAQCSRP